MIIKYLLLEEVTWGWWLNKFRTTRWIRLCNNDLQIRIITTHQLDFIYGSGVVCSVLRCVNLDCDNRISPLFWSLLMAQNKRTKEQKLFWRRNLGRKLFVISLAVVNKSGKFDENSQPGRIYLSPSTLNCKWKPNSSITNWISRDRSFVILETCIACLSQHLCGAVTLLVQC